LTLDKPSDPATNENTNGLLRQHSAYCKEGPPEKCFGRIIVMRTALAPGLEVSPKPLRLDCAQNSLMSSGRQFQNN
jgi:hypothetical protein